MHEQPVHWPDVSVDYGRGNSSVGIYACLRGRHTQWLAMTDIDSTYIKNGLFVCCMSGRFSSQTKNLLVAPF
jgi:hypothetical protein